MNWVGVYPYHPVAWRALRLKDANRAGRIAVRQAPRGFSLNLPKVAASAVGQRISDAVLFELAVEGCFADSEQAGGEQLVALPACGSLREWRLAPDRRAAPHRAPAGRARLRLRQRPGVRPDPCCCNCVGRSPSSRMGPEERAQARSMQFSSSRIFPGQSWRIMVRTPRRSGVLARLPSGHSVEKMRCEQGDIFAAVA